MLPTVEELSENVEIEGKGTHDSGSRARSTAALGVFGVPSRGGRGQRDRDREGSYLVVILLTDTSDQAVRLVLSSVVPLGVGVCGRTLVLNHRNNRVLK